MCGSENKKAGAPCDSLPPMGGAGRGFATMLIWALPAAGLFAHTPAGLRRWAIIRANPQRRNAGSKL